VIAYVFSGFFFFFWGGGGNDLVLKNFFYFFKNFLKKKKKECITKNIPPPPQKKKKKPEKTYAITKIVCKIHHLVVLTLDFIYVNLCLDPNQRSKIQTMNWSCFVYGIGRLLAPCN